MMIKTGKRSQDDKLKIGTVGLWRGQVGETKVCVMIDSDTLQLYK